MTELRSSLKLTEGDNRIALSSGLFLRNASYNLPADGGNHPSSGNFSVFQEKFNEGIYISGIVFFDDLHSLTQLHHLSGELDMVLAFVRLDIGEHPDEDNFPPNFWIISAVAEQLGALSVEADFTRPHLEKMVRAVWKAAEQTPYASDFRRIYNDAIKNAQFEDPVEALMFGA